MDFVDGHGDRLLAGGGGPAAGDGGGLCVDLDDLAVVCEVCVDFSVTCGGAVLGFAAERNVGDERAFDGIDDGGGVGVTVEGEDAVGWRVEEDCVGVFGCWDSAEYLEGVEIEHDYGLIVARGGKAVAGVLCDGGSVCALNAGDFSEQLAGVLVDDHQAGLARDVDAVTGWVGDDVVPTAVAAERVFMGDAIRGR